jgi:hypothetical protein
MADEPDGINELFASSTRIALTAAGLITERVLRAREQQHRQTQAASDTEARKLQARLTAERRAARASLAPVEHADWWDSASPDDLAAAWETAHIWSDIDPDAARISTRMRDELRSRYDIDVDNLDADTTAVHDALTRRDDDLRRTAAQRTRAARDDQEAALLVAGAERADADRHPRARRRARQPRRRRLRQRRTPPRPRILT